MSYLIAEANAYSLVSHMYWGTWAFLQVSVAAWGACWPLALSKCVAQHEMLWMDDGTWGHRAVQALR